MPIIVYTPQDLGKAIKDNAERIEITGDIKAKTVRIMEMRGALWVVAIGAISAAVLMALSTEGIDISRPPILIQGPAFSFAPVVAVAILGVDTALAAVSIALAGDGVKALSNLRKRYRLSEYSGKTTLIRKT